jgi:hypothetical protein
MSSRIALLVAAILIASANAVLAQTSTSSPATGTPAAQGMPTGSMPGSSGGMPMMGMMRMMGSMADHVEGRIAFLKTELKITDAQQPL